jgi:hypothetical protein
MPQCGITALHCPDFDGHAVGLFDRLCFTEHAYPA